MLEVFSYAFDAIAPILTLCFLGYYLKRNRILDEEFFRKMNFFNFRYCFPFLMFVNIYSLSSIRDIDVNFGFYLVLSLIILTIISLFLSSRLTSIRNRRGVISQSGFRSNYAIIGLPLVEGLVGKQGLAIATTMQAPVVIYYNFVSVLIFAIFSEEAKFNVKSIVKSIIKNPLIQGLACGLIVLIVREYIATDDKGQVVFSIKNSLPWLYTSISYLARLATPLALINLGGQFSLSQARSSKKELISCVLMRLCMAPLLGFSMMIFMEKLGLVSLSPAIIGLLIGVYASPMSVSSVPMAAEMKADYKLTGQVVVWTSLLSVITIFFMTVLFKLLGML